MAETPVVASTPLPTTCIGGVRKLEDGSFRFEEDCFTDYPKPTPTYPGLDTDLEYLVLALEQGYYPRLAEDAYLEPAHQNVKVYLTSNLEKVVEWLEGKKLYPQGIYEYPAGDYWLTGSLRLYAPVALLGELSRQEGVTSIEGPPVPLSAPCPPDCDSKWRPIWYPEVGQSKEFIIHTNLPDPPGARLSLNRPGDAGNLSLGNCPGAIGEGGTYHNGDMVTITACSPGEAWADGS